MSGVKEVHSEVFCSIEDNSLLLELFVRYQSSVIIPINDLQ